MQLCLVTCSTSLSVLCALAKSTTTYYMVLFSSSSEIFNTCRVLFNLGAVCPNPAGQSSCAVSLCTAASKALCSQILSLDLSTQLFGRASTRENDARGRFCPLGSTRMGLESDGTPAIKWIMFHACFVRFFLHGTTETFIAWRIRSHHPCFSPMCARQGLDRLVPSRIAILSWQAASCSCTTGTLLSSIRLRGSL